MKPEFKLKDRVCREGSDEVYTIAAIGPRHRKPDEKTWYTLRGEGELSGAGYIKSYLDAFEHELRPSAEKTMAGV